MAHWYNNLLIKKDTIEVTKSLPDRKKDRKKFLRSEENSEDSFSVLIRPYGCLYVYCIGSIGAVTFSIMTLSIMTLSIMTLSIMTQHYDT